MGSTPSGEWVFPGIVVGSINSNRATCRTRMLCGRSRLWSIRNLHIHTSQVRGQRCSHTMLILHLIRAHVCWQGEMIGNNECSKITIIVCMARNSVLYEPRSTGITAYTVVFTCRRGLGISTVMPPSYSVSGSCSSRPRRVT